MAKSALPLLLGAAAAVFLLGKKGGGTAGTDTGNGDGDDNGNGDGNGTDDGTGNGGGGIGLKGGLAGGGGTQTIIKSLNFSDIGFGGNAIGAKSKCARIVFLPEKVGDTLEIKGWPAGTYSVLASGGTYVKAEDVIKASAVGDRLLVTLTSGTVAPNEFDVRFRGGKQAFGGLDKLRYLYFAGIPQSPEWNCPDNLKQS